MPAQRSYEYDVVLSYAGENRCYVEKVAEKLKAENVRLFYDMYEQVDLWGRNLYDHLSNVYEKKGKYCVLFVSEFYKEKIWTNHERQSAQARALEEKGNYILPARFDNTEIPGIASTLGYIDLNKYTPSQFAELIIKKLNNNQINNIPSGVIVKEPERRWRKWLYGFVGVAMLIAFLGYAAQPKYPNLTGNWALTTAPSSTWCAKIINDPRTSEFVIWNENKVKNGATWVENSSPPRFKTTDFAGGEYANFIDSSKGHFRDIIQFDDHSTWARVSNDGSGYCVPWS